jgi:tyrosine-specific transport protein
MIGLIASYSLLIILGSQHIHLSYLQSSNWKYALTAIPILIISFGFHNMIPSLAMYFRGDIPRLRLTILWGSLLPLLVYLLWELVILGIIPIQGREGLIHALNQGEIATTALRKVVGLSWINTLGQAFALFAIVTSFLTQSLSLVDFLADGWKIKKIGASRLFLIFATLLPPLACAFFFPGIFLKALGFAGGFAAVILFGLLPTWMVWILRYQRKAVSREILPGGKPVLLLILICAATIFTLQVVQEANKHLFPSQTTG